jgi:transcriptional regulator with XRE-family HTH domain
MHNMIWNLKELRTSMRFSQARLSQESKVSLPTIQNIEANKANPTLDILEKLLLPLGVEFKLSPIPFDVNRAIALGVPLSESTSKVDIVVSASTLKLEARKWHRAFEMHSLSEREELSLVSFLMALKGHYPSFYEDEIKSPIFEQKISHYKTSGKVIKLRRMALAQMSKYL